MDFFQAEARAKQRTSRLLALFGLAVLGTIAAAYLAALLLWGYTGRHPGPWNPRLFGATALGTLGVVGLASWYKWNEYSAGGRAVAESVGGRRLDPGTTDLAERRLLNVVEEMAIASGVPVPTTYVLENEAGLNAFAAGLTRSDAIVAVTRGTLAKLNRDELQGVIGHEFSHILNGDMRLNLRIGAAVFGILVLGLMGRGILWSLGQTRSSGSSRRSGGGLIVGIALLGISLVIIGYVGYFFGRLIQAAVSRQREFLADASAVQFTRNPLGLVGALKKIGGYALGSTMDSSKSAEIGHFFFAQAFRSGFTGLWSTHPPLDERIRAIDPKFDGKMFEPPQIVDVAHESFAQAGFPPARSSAPPSPLSPRAATVAIASVGRLTSEQITNAQILLASTPARLQAAAHDAAEAPSLVYGILLDSDPAVRARQQALITTHAGADAARVVAQLDPALRELRPEQRLPLLQIALPVLKEIPRSELERFLDTLDELVHADAQVSIFEFALQKLIARTLALNRDPGAVVMQYYSFNAVIDDIAVVLSALAHAATADSSAAAAAFHAGASQIKLIEARLTFIADGADLAALDRALDKLALASGPIKQRTLVAAAHVVSADGQILITEAELLRAISAALDCPMPPLAATD